ncbi:MAG TPA: hypothetical protein VFC73_02375 [Syntrophomonadaceae bacterium]|nr:hypothetical protein [Syntrophomonadaceae bacterium]
MFFTFLNKETVSWIDFSIMENYSPNQVLFYYYDSLLTIHLKTYTELLETKEKGETNKNLNKWCELLEDIGIEDEAGYFQENGFLLELGPYYYPNTNTRFYISKNYLAPANQLVKEDLEILLSLHLTPKVNKELQAYNKSRKNAKKTSKNKEEAIKDVKMCIKSLYETESLNQHINYINKLLESRYSMVEKENLEPHEPNNAPVKPSANENNISYDNIIPFTKIKFKNKNETSTNPTFNHDLKVYLIRYREFEKACDRYKLILNEWPNLYKIFMDKCYEDIDMAEENLKRISTYMKMYNNIISKSFVHPDYQDIEILETFAYCLETGRANDLQDCMNLFEEEKHWRDVKASQVRIENTIYFLQSETDLTRFADENILEYLKKFNETAAIMEKVNN